MSDIVKRLVKEIPHCRDARDYPQFDRDILAAADLIERQREALRVAREALFVSKEYIQRRRGGFADTEPEDDAIATIDAALKSGDGDE